MTEALTPPVAIADDPLFDAHVAPTDHPERPARLKGARAGLRQSQVFESALFLPRREAQFEELVRVHDESYLVALAKTRGHEGYLDGDTFYSARSQQATLRATGAALSVVDALLSGQCDYGMTLSRPPGHHARPGTGMGFCLLNHAAVAARHALERGAKRVLILDWDVHHGNGTEEIFEADPRVLYVSLHQSPQYPGTGAVGDVGRGEGEGHTVNVPLSAGATDTTYTAAFDRLILPIVEQFDPDVSIVSAGYDAHELDPLGGMKLSANGYGALTALLTTRLRALGKPRVGFFLEGGYHVGALQDCVRTTLDALVISPDEPQPSALLPRHDAEIERARRLQAPYWKSS